MNAQIGPRHCSFVSLSVSLLVWALGAGCAPHKEAPEQRARAIEPLAIILAPHSGSRKSDVEIRRWQEQIRAGKSLDLSIERLGWAFVAKARESFDAGFYRLAEESARALDTRHPHSLEALLLRGHALHNLHRFHEAEPLARELVRKRGLPCDLGLLSDVLMEQGKLEEAAEVCQKMLDLRPDLHSYARGAHVRWLKGNVAGALTLMSMAASAASPLDSESAAWVHTRLAGYQFQLSTIPEAEQTCDQALEFQRDYPPALLLKGRLFLAQGKYGDAAFLLRRAAELNPLPEYQWALSEALRADHKTDEAASIDAQLHGTAASSDPRTYSLYLATRGERADIALRLARTELDSRSDVFTHDAMAWALAAQDHLDEARDQIKLALAEGTKDARLFVHAAVIARRSGNPAEARRWWQQASELQHLLLPSERAQLKDFPAEVVVMAGSGTKQKGNIP